jgi:hypothetical protein
MASRSASFHVLETETETSGEHELEDRRPEIAIVVNSRRPAMITIAMGRR